MAFKPSKTQIIERALRLIRAYSINDIAPDPAHVAEAEFWLASILNELSATTRLVQRQTIDGRTISLTTGVQEIDLSAGTPDTDEESPSLTQIPPNGIADVNSVRLEIDGLDQGAIELVSSAEWEQIVDKDDTGRPCRGLVVFRGNEKPSLLLHPVPTFTTGTWNLRLVVQQYMAAQVDELDDEINLVAGWERMLTLLLAADLGSGPIMTRTNSEISEWRREGMRAKRMLEAYSNRERTTRPRRVAAY